MRVIAATNKNLRDLIAQGLFREDLFYRLNVIHIAVPPLRDRKEDIPLLIEYFLTRFTRNNGSKVPAISPEAFQALKAGQSDAATSIDATAMFMQQRGDFTRAISGVFPQTACFAFANKTLADAVVGALNELKKDGFYDKLLDQYGVLKMDGSTFAISGPGPA